MNEQDHPPDTTDPLARQAKLAAVARLLSGLVHDLRNPLASVRNAAYLLNRKIPAEEAKLHEYVDIVERETARADEILSHVSAGARGKPPVPRPVDLARVIERARARVAAPDTVVWHVSFDPDPLVLSLDPGQFEEVFFQLFRNSVEAIRGSGQIAVRAARTADRHEILVADSGPGIPAAVRPGLFEPLVTTKPEGLGLGLAMSRQIVERHQGTLDLVESAQGAAFRISFPQ